MFARVLIAAVIVALVMVAFSATPALAQNNQNFTFVYFPSDFDLNGDDRLDRQELLLMRRFRADFEGTHVDPFGNMITFQFDFPVSLKIRG